MRNGTIKILFISRLVQVIDLATICAVKYIQYLTTVISV